MATRKEFTKDEVVQMLKDLQSGVPTVTDDKHQAHWWNESFGTKIKTSFSDALEIVIKEIKTMAEFY